MVSAIVNALTNTTKQALLVLGMFGTVTFSDARHATFNCQSESESTSMFTSAQQDHHEAPSGTHPHDSQPCVPYLHDRDGHFYFKRRIPAAIQWAFGGVKQIWKSLETSKLDEAVKALKAIVEDFEAQAEKARQLKGAAAVRREQIRRRGAGTTKYLLEAHIEPLLERFAHAHLTTDDQERCGLTREERVERSGELESALAQMLEQAASDRHAGYEEVVQELLAGEHLLAPPGSAIRHNLLRRLLQRDIRIVEIQLERLQGRVTPTAMSEPAAPRRLATMLDLFDSWKPSQERPRTLDTYRGFVAEFEDLVGALPCVAIELEEAEAFCSHLEARGRARETIENYIGGMATLFRYGLSKGLMPLTTPNAFDVVNLDHLRKRPRSEDRRGFEAAELNIFFHSPLYTSDYRSTGQTTDAERWVPLVAAFTGGRIEEICQVRSEDLLRINGVWVLRFAELDEDQSLKNDGSWRYVPIHAELVCCGFLAYAASVRLAGSARLFPTLTNVNKYALWSNALGKWASRYLDSIGLEDDRLCFHSFRFSFRQSASDCGVSVEARDALTGHWVSGTAGGRGYMRVAERQYSLSLLAEAMKMFRYSELDLSHLYVADPMMGVEEAFDTASMSATIPRTVKRKRAS